jgi:hypothetical protein
MMLPTFNSKSFSQYCGGTTSHKLFVQYTDPSLVACLADAVDESWPIFEFAQSRGQRVLFASRYFIAVQAGIH